MEYFKELKDIITNNYCELIYLNYCFIFYIFYKLYNSN